MTCFLFFYIFFLKSWFVKIHIINVVSHCNFTHSLYSFSHVKKCNTLDVFLTSNAGIFSVWQAWGGKKQVYFSQSLIKYLTCLIIEAHDSPRAVRYVGVLGVRDKREVWCLAWRNHLLLMKKKKNEEISFLSVVYTVLRLVLSTISYILKHHVSRAIMRHDPFPIIIIIIISNRLLTPHSYLDLSTGGAD